MKLDAAKMIIFRETIASFSDKQFFDIIAILNYAAQPTFAAYIEIFAKIMPSNDTIDGDYLHQSMENTCLIAMENLRKDETYNDFESTGDGEGAPMPLNNGALK